MLGIKKHCITLVEIFRMLYCDFKYQMGYSLSSPFNNTEQMALAKIMLTMHQLEKGLSHNPKRKNWGGEKARELSKNIINFFNLYQDNVRVQTGIDILFKYSRDEAACKDEDLMKLIDEVIKYKRPGYDYGGTKEVRMPVFQCEEDDIWQFFESRHSIRDYSDEEISTKEIEKAVKFASLTPTACNRQTSKVYAFRDKNLINKILDTQLGNQGWCNNAKVLFVIVGNGSYFNVSYESKQVYIDGGMYSMNFCMGLHLQKIGTCFKMFVRRPKEERQFRKITGIKDFEIPIVLIMAGHYPTDGNIHYSPKSHRIVEYGV